MAVTDDHLAGIRRIEDPMERLGALADALAESERRAADIRALRDGAIRACRDAGVSVPRIAAVAKVSGTTVKAVLR